MKIANAVLKVKSKIKGLYKSKEGFNGKYNYVPLDTILSTLNPILVDAGLTVIIAQKGIVNVDGKVYYEFTASLMYDEESIVLSYFIPESSTPKKKRKANDPEPEDNQSTNNPIMDFGATMTYGQRYIYQALFGIPMDTEDPDSKDVSSKFIHEDINDVLTILVNTKIEATSKANIIKEFINGNYTKDFIIENLK